MSRPVVGVIGNAYRVENRFTTQMVGENRQKYVLEFDIKCPEDAATKKKTKSAADVPTEDKP